MCKKISKIHTSIRFQLNIVPVIEQLSFNCIWPNCRKFLVLNYELSRNTKYFSRVMKIAKKVFYVMILLIFYFFFLSQMKNFHVYVYKSITQWYREDKFLKTRYYYSSHDFRSTPYDQLTFAPTDNIICYLISIIFRYLWVHPNSKDDNPKSSNKFDAPS